LVNIFQFQLEQQQYHQLSLTVTHDNHWRRIVEIR